MSRRPSPQQAALLDAVASGRVTYGDPYPKRTERIARAGGQRSRTDILGNDLPPITDRLAYVQPAWMIDGYEAYGGQGGTLRSLSERGWISTADRAVDAWPVLAAVCLTDAGYAVWDWR